jgi:hypothetical protein
MRMRISSIYTDLESHFHALDSLSVIEISLTATVDLKVRMRKLYSKAIFDELAEAIDVIAESTQKQ